MFKILFKTPILTLMPLVFWVFKIKIGNKVGIVVQITNITTEEDNNTCHQHVIINFKLDQMTLDHQYK
jgi:hypothetical protein